MMKQKGVFTLLCILLFCVFSDAGDMPTFTLKAEVVFEENDALGENYIFQNPRREFGVDTAGNIYIADNRLSFVAKYDRNGKFVKRIGRAGQGPGELFYPQLIQIAGDKLVVVD